MKSLHRSLKNDHYEQTSGGDEDPVGAISNSKRGCYESAALTCVQQNWKNSVSNVFDSEIAFQKSRQQKDEVKEI